MKKQKSSEKNLEDDIKAILGQYHEMGISEISIDLLALRVGYAKTTKIFTQAVSRMNKGKLINKKNGEIGLSEEGAANLPAAERTKSNQEVQEDYIELILVSAKGAIPKDKLRLFWEVLADGNAHKKKEIADRAKYSITTKAVAKFIALAKSFNILDKKGDSFQFTEKVFPCGRP